MAKRGRPRKVEQDLVTIVAELTDDLNDARKLAEDRFHSGQALARQLVAAEDRIKELMDEIRMHEHEHSTLRHIIIDALQGYK